MKSNFTIKNNNIVRSDPRGGGGVDLYAHRGSMVLAPENTRQAFEAALGYGADVLEIDVRLSRDRKVVVIHDATVDRTCNGHGAIKDFTLRELQRLDAGYHFTDLKGRPARGQNVVLSSLDELFELFPRTRINIDIKDDFYEATAAVALAIEKSGKRSLVNVGSFHAQSVAWFRQLAPSVSTAATKQEVAKLYFGRRLNRQPQYQYVQIPTRYYGLHLATRRFIEHARSRGLKCVYWTINDEASICRLRELGVSGLVTDRVDIAGQLLGKSAAT